MYSMKLRISTTDGIHVKIGYGGSGSWRNWYVLRANQKI